MRFNIVAGLVITLLMAASPAYAKPDNGPAPPKDTRPKDTVIKKWFLGGYCFTCDGPQWRVILLSGRNMEVFPWDYRNCDVGERWTKCATYPYNKIKEKAKV